MGKNNTKTVRVNGDIRVPRVRVILDGGEQLGILATRDAIAKAMDNGLDLVEISPNADPPVCRIMDYGKYKYQLSKKQAEARKKQTIIQVKEVKLRLKTETHDINTKIRNLHRFVKQGNKVKISIVFRGREITHPELAYAMFERILGLIEDSVTVEARPRMEGRALVMLVGPKSDNK